jgi:sucrose-6-phosphate hydrolase SacC (GH32 family)
MIEILLDRSVVEVFVNEGEFAFSNLIFPKSQSQDVEIFGLEEQIEVFDHELKKTMGNSITANI